MITVADQQLEIDVQEELSPYMEQFSKATIRDDKLQSCSPFREDSHPSFAVNLENGSWIDSGATDIYRKGHFVQLLSFLREEEHEDTVEYLLALYSLEKRDVDSLSIDLSWLEPQAEPVTFDTADLQKYAFRSPYLGNRGISEEVQRAFRIGYDREHRAIAMPWTDSNGTVINIKFRAVDSKRFWYSKGQRLKYHLYGLQKIVSHNIEQVWLVESEIDCLRLWSLGIPAVAFGTSNMSQQQEKLLLNNCINSVIIAVDNDSAGEQFKQDIIKRLTGRLEISEIIFPDKTVKDISDMTDLQIQRCKESAVITGLELELTL